LAGKRWSVYGLRYQFKEKSGEWTCCGEKVELTFIPGQITVAAVNTYGKGWHDEKKALIGRGRGVIN